MGGMNRALIVIDVQESFRARPLWEEIANPKIAEPVNRLVRLARANGDLVVWVLHTEPGSGGVFDPAQGHVRLLDELEQPQSGEPVLHKTSHNAFTTTSATTDRGGSARADGLREPDPSSAWKPPPGWAATSDTGWSSSPTPPPPIRSAT